MITMVKESSLKTFLDVIIELTREGYELVKADGRFHIDIGPESFHITTSTTYTAELKKRDEGLTHG